MSHISIKFIFSFLFYVYFGVRSSMHVSVNPVLLSAGQWGAKDASSFSISQDLIKPSFLFDKFWMLHCYMSCFIRDLFSRIFSKRHFFDVLCDYKVHLHMSLSGEIIHLQNLSSRHLYGLWNMRLMTRIFQRLKLVSFSHFLTWASILDTLLSKIFICKRNISSTVDSKIKTIFRTFEMWP